MGCGRGGELFGGGLDELVARTLRLAAGPHPHVHHDESEFPALDVYEAPGELVVEAELPGVDLARVEVSVAPGALVIEGVKDEDPVGGQATFLCMERAFGPFRRSVPLPAAADLTRVAASYRAGVLQVRVPRVDERRGMRRVVPVATERTDEGREP